MLLRFSFFFCHWTSFNSFSNRLEAFQMVPLLSNPEHDMSNTDVEMSEKNQSLSNTVGPLHDEARHIIYKMVVCARDNQFHPKRLLAGELPFALVSRSSTHCPTLVYPVLILPPFPLPRLGKQVVYIQRRMKLII